METLNKEASKKGLIIAAITIFIQLITYYVFPKAFGSTVFGLLSGLVSLGIYIYFTIDLRKEIGGYWSFSQALKGIFLMAFVAGLVSSVFLALFYTYIETGAYAKIEATTIEGLTKTYESLGMDQAKIDEVMPKALEGIQSQFKPTIGQFFKTLGIVIIVEFVMSLIFAAIFKKEPPLFVADETIEQ